MHVLLELPVTPIASVADYDEQGLTYKLTRLDALSLHLCPDFIIDLGGGYYVGAELPAAICLESTSFSLSN